MSAMLAVGAVPGTAAGVIAENSIVAHDIDHNGQESTRKPRMDRGVLFLTLSIAQRP